MRRYHFSPLFGTTTLMYSHIVFVCLFEWTTLLGDFAKLANQCTILYGLIQNL